MGTFSLPVFNTTSEAEPYVTIGSPSCNDVNGNYFNFGAKIFATSRGFTFISLVRFKDSSKSLERIIDFW